MLEQKIVMSGSSSNRGERTIALGGLTYVVWSYRLANNSEAAPVAWLFNVQVVGKSLCCVFPPLSVSACGRFFHLLAFQSKSSISFFLIDADNAKERQDSFISSLGVSKERLSRFPMVLTYAS